MRITCLTSITAVRVVHTVRQLLVEDHKIREIVNVILDTGIPAVKPSHLITMENVQVCLI